MKKIFFAGLIITTIFMSACSKSIITANNYYDNAPFYKVATLSSEKEQEIKNNIKEKENKKRISKNYKNIQEQKQEKKQEELQRQEEIRKQEELQKQEEIRKQEEQQKQEDKQEEIRKQEEISKQEEKKYEKMVSGARIQSPYTGFYDLSSVDREKGEKILNGVKKGEKEVFFESGSSDNLLSICNAITTTFAFPGMNIGLTVYTYDDSDKLSVEIANDAKDIFYKCQYVREVITNMANSLKGMTEKEAVKKLYNYITANMSYQENVRDLYSLTHNHIGNCDSYAQFFEYVCDYAGIECKSVEGKIPAGGHMWNRVKVDNIWYYIDSCVGQVEDKYLSVNLWGEYTIDKEYKRDWTFNTVN